MNRGDISAEDLKEKQVEYTLNQLDNCHRRAIEFNYLSWLCEYWTSMLIICKTSSYILEFVAQAKAMQDPEIQNILSDPIMRQVKFSLIFLYWSFLFKVKDAILKFLVVIQEGQIRLPVWTFEYRVLFSFPLVFVCYLHLLWTVDCACE